MPFLSRNVQLGPPLKLSTWRKIAIGTWRTAGDPSVYAMLEIDAEPALRYIEELKKQTQLKITFTHFVGKALAQVFQKYPDLNCILRFGRLYPRKTIDVFFQVAPDNSGKDLSGLTIKQVDQKTLPEIAVEMQARVESIRKKGDPDFKKMKKKMGFFPGLLVRYMLDIAGFIMYTLNLWSPALGSPRDPFGSFMITSIGSIGLDAAFAPLVPYSRVPLLMAVGTVKDTPVVKNGKVEIGKISKICVTFDHRIMDGMQGSKMAAAFQEIFANPEVHLGPIIQNRALS